MQQEYCCHLDITIIRNCMLFVNSSTCGWIGRQGIKSMKIVALFSTCANGYFSIIFLYKEVFVMATKLFAENFPFPKTLNGSSSNGKSTLSGAVSVLSETTPFDSSTVSRYYRYYFALCIAIWHSWILNHDPHILCATTYLASAKNERRLLGFCLTFVDFQEGSFASN